jgi:hypothetical protein
MIAPIEAQRQALLPERLPRIGILDDLNTVHRRDAEIVERFGC